MKDGVELRDQLRSLSIPREQRPGARAAGTRGGRTATVVLLIVVVLALGGYIGWDKFGSRIQAWRTTTAPAAAVQVVKVSAHRESDTSPVLTATGKIVSDHRVQVATKVSGQIVKLHFEQGQHVEKDELLAEIEEEAYQARCNEAAANLEKSKANLEFQKVNFARIEGLYRQRQASDIEYADAKRALEMAEAQVAADKATLAFVEKLLHDCKVLAPIAGVTLERNVEVGDFVAAEGGRGAMANAQLATIADMSQLRVEVDVSELDIRRLRRDMPCTVTPDAQKDRHYRGYVLWLDPGANYAKATVQVKVRIENPDDYLRVEGAAQVQFYDRSSVTTTAGAGQPTSAEAASQPARLWIPLSACRADATGQSAKVFVVAEGRWHETMITLGRREGGNVEVLAGLHDGQEIAVDGVEQLKNGEPVRR